MKAKSPTNRWLPLLYGLVSAGLLLPLVLLVYLSLVQQWEFPALLDAQYTGANWALALGGTTGIWGSILLSVCISGMVSLVATGGGWFVARAVCYNKWSGRLLALAYYPYLLAPVILGVMLQFYFIKLGISGTVTGVAVAQLLFVFPYAVLFFAGFWTPQTRALEGQAATLGASQRQIFRRILLPMARPWLGISAFQCFMISWFEYGVTQYVGIGKVPTLTVRTMQYVKEANPHVAAVAACIMVLPLVLLILLNRRLLYRNTEAHD